MMNRLLGTLLIPWLPLTAATAEPATPDFGPNVLIFDASMTNMGVYCVFYAAPVVAENAIETPAAPGVKLHHMVTIRLSGRPNSGISHVINGTGDAVITTRKAIVN